MPEVSLASRLAPLFGVGFSSGYLFGHRPLLEVPKRRSQRQSGLNRLHPAFKWWAGPNLPLRFSGAVREGLFTPAEMRLWHKPAWPSHSCLG
jgi:hypothetical protein